jgi:signal transduction histidine kinase
LIVPNRIPIRLKLTAALAIPIAALLIVAALEVMQSNDEANEVRQQTELAEASIGPGGLITNLQHERNFGSVWLLGSEEILDLPVESFDEAIANTDESFEIFRDDIEAKGGEVEETYAPAFEAFEQVEGLRRMVTEFEGDPNNRTFDNQYIADPLFQGYTEVVGALFEANTQVALAIDDPTLRRGAELSDLASRQTDAIARLIREFLLAGVGDGLHDPQEVADASAIYGEVLANQQAVRSLGNTGVYADVTQRLAEESDATGFVNLASQTLETGEVDINATLESVSIDPDYSYYGFRARVGDVLVSEANDLTAAADARKLWYFALAVLAIIVALVVTWLISRSITQPLRSLTTQAKEMAEHRLPDAVLDILETPLGDNVQVPHIEPVTVRTRDEVADVADALNTVQDSALDLAVEQAVLRRNIADSFVNLGRRNQNLLGRQLDFITELESNETDPDTLASLFRLDHLATRMRRNAESLLVLAGIDPPRKWAAPVRLTDVIRAALGEVEDYQRVTVRGVEPATILGSAAADLAHLIAEFIENALTFSPPDQNVDIRGRHRPDGYTLAIIDSGLGMPASDIAQANRRLAGAESFTIAPSKYLGHYVAGNLAARHGIHLQLDNSPGNGITATIDLPASLLTTDTPTGDPITPPHGGRPVTVPGGAAPGEMAIGPDGQPVPVGVPGNGFPGDGFPGEPMAPAAAAPPQPARTASGLVKRAPRTAAGVTRPHVPDDDLLATLSGYTGNLPQGRDPILPGNPGPMSSLRAQPQAPAPEPPGPYGGFDGPGITNRSGYGDGQPHVPPGPSPAPPPAPSMPSGPAPGYGDPAGYGAPPSVPSSGYGESSTAAPSPGAWWDAQPPTPPAPAAPGGPGAGTPDAAPWADLANLDTGPRPVVPGGPRPNGPGPRPTPPQPHLDPTSGGTTESGLARRVRGAQLPTTQPLSLRRPDEHAGPAPRDYGRDDHGAAGGNGDTVSGDPANVANGDGGPAKDVYSFLSSFTAGVQRGLDEARRDTTTSEDES